MANRTERFWGLVLVALLHIGCVESNPGPNEVPRGNNIRKRYGSFDNRNMQHWPQEEVPKDVSVCWPWNWWCRREGDLPEEEERLVQGTAERRYDFQDSSDDELLRDHHVPQDDTLTSVLPRPTSDDKSDRQRADQLEQLLKREQQQRRCYEDKIEQLRQLYESARTALLQHQQEQRASQQQALRLQDLEHQLQQEALERKRLEAALQQETEGRQRLEDLFRVQMLDKELQLRNHLEEEEIQRLRLQQELNTEQERRKDVGKLLEKTELEKHNLQSRYNDLELQLREAVRRRTECEMELLLVQTSEQELQQELGGIRKHLSKVGDPSKSYYEARSEEMFQGDTEEGAVSSEEVYWSIPEHNSILGEGKLIEPQSRRRENEELRNMLERSIEEKITLQRLLQKEREIREEMEMTAKKELKLQRKLLEKEFRKELSRLEQMFPIGAHYYLTEETAAQDNKEVVSDDDRYGAGSSRSDSISVTSEADAEENVSAEEETFVESDVVSDIIPESVDEEERQEIRQLLLEELQRLQVHAKEEQELKQQGETKQKDERYIQEKKEDEEIYTSERHDDNVIELENETDLGEKIEAILKQYPFITQSEGLYNDYNRSRSYDDHIILGNNAVHETSSLTISEIETEKYTKPKIFLLDSHSIDSSETQLNSLQNIQENDHKKGHLTTAKNAGNHAQSLQERVSGSNMPKLSKPEVCEGFQSDHGDNAVPRILKESRDNDSEDNECHKYEAVQANEPDGLSEQPLSTIKTLKSVDLSESYINEYSHNQVLDTVVKFQGCSISLRELIGEKDPSHELMRLLQKHIKEEDVTLAPFYPEAQNKQIWRSVQRSSYLKEDIFTHKSGKLRTTFAISGVSLEDIESLIPRGGTVGRLKTSGVENPGRTFVILNDSTAEKDYEELCAKAKGFRDIHWLHKDNNNRKFMWMKSRSNIKDIRKHIDVDISISYPSLTKVNERCSVVCASSGEGASTFVEQLVTEFKERDSAHWIVKVYMSENQQTIGESQFVNEQILEILWKGARAHSDLEKKLFEHFLYKTGRIIVLLHDTHKNIDEAQALLKFLLETKINRIIVTINPQWRNLFEDCVSTLAFQLAPLSENEQKKFLVRRWNIGNKDQQLIEDFSVAVLRAAALGRLTLTPLYLTLLADSFKVSLENYLSKNYIEIPPSLDEKLLYKHYIKACLEQEALENNSPIETGKLRDLYFRSATNDALAILFPEYTFTLPSDDNNGSYKWKMKAMPYCVKEYLCAKWFGKHFEKYRSFIREKYFDKELRRVWFLFDQILTEHSELHVAALYGDVNRVEELVDAGVDVHAIDCGGRTPIHVAAIRGHISATKLLMQKMEKGCDIKDRVLEWTPLRYADEAENWEVMELLLETGECPSNLERTRECLHDEGGFQQVIARAASAGYKHLFRNLLSISDFSLNTVLRTSNYCHHKYTLLHIAAENGHAQIVDYLMRLPVVRIDIGTWDGSTPLHLAARHGHIETARRLLSRKGTVLYNKHGDTCLHEAVRNGHVNVATVLLAEGGADPNSRNVAGDSPLHIACTNGDITFVSLLLDYGAEKNMLDGSGDTPLDRAIKCGQSTVVRYLVDKCGSSIVVDTHQRKVDGNNTALHVAATVGDTLSMEYFLKAVGSEAINTPNEGGDTPLHFAALHGRSAMVEYLVLKHGADPTRINKYNNTAVHLAVIREDCSTVRVLLAHSPALVDVANGEGNLPLHLAARRGSPQMIRCLLQYDHDKHTVTVKNHEMRTPLQLAVERSDVDVSVAEMLVQAGSDVNARDRHGNTLLHQAVSLARADVVRLLLSTGLAVTELRNSSGYTALLSAVKACLAELTIILADGGADVNVCTSDGNSALHEAVVAGNPHTVTALLQRGANPDARNAESNTALHRAVYHNSVDMVRLLVEQGANINSRNLIGQSPRDLALHLHVAEDILLYL